MHLTLGNKNIKLYRQLDKGLYFALNKGLSYATGEVISILHAGDYFYNSTVLFKLYSYIKKNCNDSIFAIQAGGRFLYANNNYTDSFKKSNAYYLRYFYMPLNHPSLFISTDFYKKYGLFDTTFPIAADYELTLKLFKHNIPIFYINELFVTIAPLGLSGKKVNYNSIRELYQIKTKYFNIYFAFLTSLILYTYLIFKELFFKKRILKNNNESK
jgi:glycosyltransferase